MRRAHGWLWLLGAATLVAAGCGGAASGKGGARGSAEPVSGGTLMCGTGLGCGRLDPAHETDGESYKVLRQHLREPGRLRSAVDAGSARARHNVGDHARRQDLHLPPARRRQLPRRHAARRRRRRLLPRSPTQSHPGARVPLGRRPVHLLVVDVDGRHRPGHPRRRRFHGGIHAQAPQRAVPRQPGDGLLRHREPDRGAQVPRRLLQASDGHGTVPLRRVGEGRSHRARAQSRLLAREGVSRQGRVPCHSREHGAPAGARAGRHHGHGGDHRRSRRAASRRIRSSSSSSIRA